MGLSEKKKTQPTPQTVDHRPRPQTTGRTRVPTHTLLPSGYLSGFWLLLSQLTQLLLPSLLFLPPSRCGGPFPDCDHTSRDVSPGCVLTAPCAQPTAHSPQPTAHRGIKGHPHEATRCPPTAPSPHPRCPTDCCALLPCSAARREKEWGGPTVAQPSFAINELRVT